MGAATEAAAKANPTQKFGIVDCSYASGCITGTKEPNIDQLVFNTVQDGFLGGDPGAGGTKTRQVATFGGVGVATPTISMEGFPGGGRDDNSKHRARRRVPRGK